MAQGSGAGKFVLYLVLGIVGVVIGIQVLQWLFGALLSLVWLALVTAVIVGVTMLVIRAARRSVGGNDRRRLPR